jgi:hypothetical protein
MKGTRNTDSRKTQSFKEALDLRQENAASSNSILCARFLFKEKATFLKSNAASST